MMAKSFERWIAAAAVVVLLGMLGWFLMQRRVVNEIAARTVSVSLAADAHDAAPITVPASSVRIWSDPAVDAAQPDWVFDVFTPPVIYYNRLTRAFTVTPPDYSAPTEPVVEEVVVPFGVELVEVSLDPFRLQLVGYAGGEGNYLGMFENVNTGDTLLGRAGKVFPDLGLTVLSLEVNKERIELPDSMPIVQTVAHARVRDDSTGEEFDLTSLKRRATGSPSAVLRVVATGEQRTEKVGNEFTVGDVVYRVDEMDVDAGTVTITRTGPDADAEPKTELLTPGTSSPATPMPAPDPGDAPAPEIDPATDPAAPVFPGF